MVNENIIPKTETVYEIKNEIPTYEEFMETYKPSEASEFLAEAGSSAGKAVSTCCKHCPK